MKGLFLLFPFILFALPQEFAITEELFALRSSFDIENLATATKRIFSFSSTYDLTAKDGSPLATGQVRIFAWGTVIDIYDPEGHALGRIEENVWRIFPWAEYQIYNAENQIIAHAIMDLFGTEFTLHEPSAPDCIKATIHRPWIHWFRDSWTVQIIDPSYFEHTMDPRLLYLLAIFQTDKENQDRRTREIQDRLRRELDDLN